MLNLLRRRLRRLRGLADSFENPIVFTQYVRGRVPEEPLALHHIPAAPDEGLPVPPRSLWLGYGSTPEEYVDSGAADVRTMREVLAAADFDLDLPDGNLLDLGCGAGRMLRHLRAAAQIHEVWGADISAPHIHWLRAHLSPPFHFAVTTLIPHLPFPDGHFACAYCGSVFTHIDDLADAWWMELRRVLRPGGLLFCTLHDDSTRALLQSQAHHPIIRTFRGHPAYLTPGAAIPDVLAIGEGHDVNVFYSDRWLRAHPGRLYEIAQVRPAAYGYQTAWLFRRPPA